MSRTLVRKVLVGAVATLMFSIQAFAGNPDRQGESGAVELLFSVWARSSGVHTLNTSYVSGVEAMRLNVAGLSRINKSEIIASHMILFDGTGIGVNSLGFGQKIGESGAFGIAVTAVDFGDISVTTENNPEGTGATFSPRFFHLALAYSNTFANKVSVGLLLRGISQSTSDLNAFGFALDAGVQYVTGPDDNFKFGISLRNVGSPMRFGGDGLSFRTDNPSGNVSYEITVDQRAARFELPSVLNIGVSYDFLMGGQKTFRLTVLGNFTANSFSRDQIGGGIEFAFKEMFMVRGGYRHDMGGEIEGLSDNAYTGLAGGVTIEVPISKKGTSRFAIDYAYRATNPFSGTHNFSILYKI